MALYKSSLRLTVGQDVLWALSFTFLPIDSHSQEYKSLTNQNWLCCYQHSIDVSVGWYAGYLSASDTLKCIGRSGLSGPWLIQCKFSFPAHYLRVLILYMCGCTLKGNLPQKNVSKYPTSCWWKIAHCQPLCIQAYNARSWESMNSVVTIGKNLAELESLLRWRSLE